MNSNRDSCYIPGRVSIVTPVYNGAGYIQRLLESILAQNYPKLQLILVDDGSEDGTAETAEAYREALEARNIEFCLLREAHSCAAGAVSRGLREVNGEYLIWPDGDDELDPESIAKRVAFLQEHPEFAAVRSLPGYFMEDGSPAGADETIGDVNKTELFWDVLYSRTFVSCGCYMLRTEPFFHIYPGRSIPVYPVGQNFQMLLPFLYRHPCATLPETLYRVTIRSGSHSRTPLNREQEFEKYAAYERMIDELAEIAGITAGTELRHIRAWKLERRYQLCKKYGCRWEALWTLLRWYLTGYLGTGRFISILGKKAAGRLRRCFRRRSDRTPGREDHS